MDAQTILPLLLGSGGAMFIGALFTGVRAIQSGANQKARESIADLAKWRDEADDRRRKAEAERDAAISRGYAWKNYAGGLEFVIVASGLVLPENLKRPVD
jgi:hypothetical protein